MIAHVVLFRPRRGLSRDERLGFTTALDTARQQISSIRRFRVGRRIVHGREYEQAMTQDFPYAAVIEFDDLSGLKAYLAHPAHQELGRLFGTSLEAGLVYDYEMSDTVEGIREEALKE